MNNLNHKEDFMKKRTIIPAVIAMGFFAGCDWASWCSCSKKTTTPVEQHESKSELPVEKNVTEEDHSQAAPKNDEEKTEEDATPKDAEQEDDQNPIMADLK